MSQNSVFAPARVQVCEPPAECVSPAAGDERRGRVYVYHDDDIMLAVNVAWATGRPLLVSGPSGCGKSSLAMNVALTLNWRYYEFVVTARTTARDLLWNFDAVRRLNDAHAGQGGLKSDAAYIEPGVLWWAFDRKSALTRGSTDGLPEDQMARDPWPTQAAQPAVVLIDEIDKAEPTVPNDLLVPLGSLQFRPPHRDRPVAAQQTPLLIITNNGERELPTPFLRRCVTLTLAAPDRDRLFEIARASIPKERHDEGLFGKLVDLVLQKTELDSFGTTKRQPSTAEYLDAVRACLALKITSDDPRFARLIRLVLEKDQYLQSNV
ncbi:MAG: MoxR family ATPase [Pirellulaceae bacterium]|nr:MoxR family ATPase [Pirellulaceae bacterium]